MTGAPRNSRKETNWSGVLGNWKSGASEPDVSAVAGEELIVEAPLVLIRNMAYAGYVPRRVNPRGSSYSVVFAASSMAGLACYPFTDVECSTCAV